MQIHQLKPKKKRKSKKRIGRGGKRGTYSGKGVKGQKSRAGKKFQPLIRNLVKKYPKLRGYRFNLSSDKIVGINLKKLKDKFEDNEKVTPHTLIEKGIVNKIEMKAPQVKILGEGEIDKKIIVENCLVSESAKKKIEKAGGKII